jgi:hypothetical protein
VNEEPALKDITAGRFRANHRMELVLFDRLSADQRQMLSGLQTDADFYGILRPREPSGLGIKSVCRETALLFLTLQQPGAMPAYVRRTFGRNCNKAIAELVLDRILEIERAGAFVSGLDAHDLIFEGGRKVESGGTLSRLSDAALQYAEGLNVREPSKLSARLYFYNRVPCSPKWLQRLPSREAVAEYLGFADDGPHAVTLRRHWGVVSLEAPYDGWRMWRVDGGSADGRRLPFKLYVSPACKCLRETFAVLLDVLTRLKAPRFKVGGDVYGLLRPDKYVVYFDSQERLGEAAEQLRDRLGGYPAQGVPFTAEYTSDGLLSWGMDPPRTTAALGWQERESWRLWLTNRLAAALLAARESATTPLAPWQFARERVQLEGVDTTTWTPDPSIWDELL